MRIVFTGRHTEVPEPLRRLGQRKLAKLALVLPGITRAHVVLSSDRHRQIAEVNVHSPHLELAAQEVSTDLGVSLAAAFDKVARQAHHHAGKRIDRRRRAEVEKQPRTKPRPKAAKGQAPRAARKPAIKPRAGSRRRKGQGRGHVEPEA
jgi:ribosome hibernation promoting factor